MPARKRDSAPRAMASGGTGAHEERKRVDAATRRREKAAKARRARIDELEARIADREDTLREVERAMSAPGFYDDRAAAQPLVDRHQALMWELGDLMHQWEELQSASDVAAASEA